MSQAPPLTARAAALKGFSALASSYGLKPAALFAEAGLPSDAERDPERRLPTLALNRLLESAAFAAGAEDFGLRLADLRGFSNLGPVSMIARDEPDVRSALGVFIRYLPLHNDALAVHLSEARGLSILTTRVFDPGAALQARDLAVAMLLRILRQLLGPRWEPEMVCLERPRPMAPTRFSRYLGERLSFEQEFSGIVLMSSDLDRPNPMAEVELRPYAQAMLANADVPRDLNVSERCRRLVETLLASRQCSAQQVAVRLQMSRRSLDRALAREGTSFLKILDGARRDIAARQIGGSGRSITEIADILGFRSASAFSTWFRAQFGEAPRIYRARAGDAAKGALSL